MKKLIITGCMLVSTLVVSSSAQSLTAAPGKSSSLLFQTPTGYTLGGLDFDSSNNAYYLLQSASDTTKLVRRNAADGYSAATTLFDFGSTVYGSFVRLNGQKIYFGESSAWSIRTFDLTTSTPALLATVVGNYDLAVGGGFGWLSANAGAATFSAQNQILKLDLVTGATTTVLTSSDYSGPVALDNDGALFYGANEFGAGGDVFKYTASELAVGGLTLDGAHKFRDNVNNASFAYTESSPALFTTDYASIFRESVGPVAEVQTWATSTNFIGYLADANSVIYAGVTDYGTNRSAVYSVVPEPSSIGLLALAAGLLGVRRRVK
jgi:hypothetical protein